MYDAAPLSVMVNECSSMRKATYNSGPKYMWLRQNVDIRFWILKKHFPYGIPYIAGLKSCMLVL